MQFPIYEIRQFELAYGGCFDSGLWPVSSSKITTMWNKYLLFYVYVSILRLNIFIVVFLFIKFCSDFSSLKLGNIFRGNHFKTQRRRPRLGTRSRHCAGQVTEVLSRLLTRGFPTWMAYFYGKIPWKEMDDFGSLPFWETSISRRKIESTLWLTYQTLWNITIFDG